ESNPSFTRNDEWIAYSRSQNLYAWNIKSGITEQLTDIRAANAAPQANRPPLARGSFQDEWLQQEQLRLFDVLRARKQKRDERTAFLKTVRDNDTLKTINIGDKTLQGLQISPNGQFIIYRLVIVPQNQKITVVPDYVTESGFTTDIPNRT